jgi:hypothetical protein
VVRQKWNRAYDKMEVSYIYSPEQTKHEQLTANIQDRFMADT